VRLCLPLAGVSLVLTLLVLGAGLALAPPQLSPPSGELRCRHAPLKQIAVVAGEGHLCSDSSGIHPGMHLRNLSPGAAYSAWFVYFDRASACVAQPCGLADMVGGDARGLAARIDATIAGEDGVAVLQAAFRGLRLSSGSQVSLMLVSHGPPSEQNNQIRARQLLVDGPFWLKGSRGGPVTDDDSGMVVASVNFVEE